MTMTVTPTPRDRFGMTVIHYTDEVYVGAVVFNNSGVCIGAGRRRDGSHRFEWLDNPEDLPAGVYDAARAAYLETL